jgi:uncharacterized SAM-binding protein YcdF (DUF218 family)
MVGVEGFAALAVSLAVVAATLGASLAAAYLAVLRTARRARAEVDGRDRRALVLGMRLGLNGEIAPAYRERLERAAALLGAGAVAEVVLLGGRTGRDGLSEAEAGRGCLAARGVPAKRIRTEDTSRHTLENLARYRASFGMGGAPVVLVTSRAHLGRAGLMARGLGIAHEPCAAEAAWRSTPASLASILVEAFYMHWYLSGRTFARLTRNRAMLRRIG